MVFFFNDTATTEIYTLSLHDALPIYSIKNAARDAEESQSKFNAVFSSISEKGNEAASKMAKSFGLAGSTAKEMIGDTGDLLTGFGFSQQAAFDMSVEVNKLAVDLASFKNSAGGAKGASDALTKALLGERESLKSLGIAILESDVKKQVAINRAKGLVFETKRQAKAHATLQIAMEQGKNAIGDYSRTKMQLANVERKTTEDLKMFREELGVMLLPAFLKINSIIQKVISKFRGLSPEMKKNIVIAAGIVAALGPVLLILGSIALVIPLISSVLGALGVVAFLFNDTATTEIYTLSLHDALPIYLIL